MPTTYGKGIRREIVEKAVNYWSGYSHYCICVADTGRIYQEKEIKKFSRKCVAQCGTKLSCLIERQ